MGEVSLIGPKLVYEVIKKVQLIRERFKMAQSRLMSYVDVRIRDLEFYMNEWVYLKFHL